MNQRILRLPDVQFAVGLGKTAIYARIKKGEFPKPIKLGKLSGWLETEIMEWITLQAEQSR